MNGQFEYLFDACKFCDDDVSEFLSPDVDGLLCRN